MFATGIRGVFSTPAVRLGRCLAVFFVLALTPGAQLAAESVEASDFEPSVDIAGEAESATEAGEAGADESDAVESVVESGEWAEEIVGEDESPSVLVEEEQEQDPSLADIIGDEPEESWSGTALEEVIVTSTKRATSLQTTPVAVSAFTQDALDREKVLDITNIADLVPNLQIGESPSDSGVTIAVRGISSNNFTEIGDPTVGIHVDGVFTPRPQAALALLHDVERIEINRGPQGTLFGRNSTAGSINIISSRPQFDAWAGQYEIDAGSFNHYTFRGWTNMALSDSYALRFSFLYDISGSYFNQVQDNFDFAWDDNGDGDFNDQYDVAPDGVANVDQRRSRPVSGRDVYGGTDRYAVRLNSLLSTSETYTWLVSFDYFRDSSPGSFSVKDCEKAEGTFYACEGSQWDVPINTPGALDFRLFTVRSELVWDLADNLRMEFRVGNSRQFRDQYYDNDGGARGDPGHPAYGLDRDSAQSPVSAAYQERYGKESTVSHLVQGGPNGDNQYVLDVLGFSDYTITPWEDLALITRYSNYDSRVFELQFSSIADPDNPVEWIAGAFFMHEDNEIRFDVEGAFNGGIKRPIALAFVQPNRDIESLAVFGQVDVPFSEKFRMTFGLRWTLDEKSDTGGLNYRSVGYWEGAYAYTSSLQTLQTGGNTPYFAPGPNFRSDIPASEQIPYSAYDLVGIVENPDLFQSDDLTLDQGTYSPEILDRILEANDGDITPNTFADTWAQWTWKIGFDYVINDRWFWYGYVATGYKAGGFTDKVDLCGGRCGSFPVLEAFPYRPERNLTYETGVKATLFDSERVGKMNLILTAFLSNVSDYQVTTFAQVTSPGTVFEIEREDTDPDKSPEDPTRLVTVTNSVGNLLTFNIGESRNSGLEIEFDWWNPWPDGRIFGWITFLNAEVRDLLASDGYFCFERAYLGLTPCPASDPSIPDDPGTSEDESRRINFKGNKLPWAPQWALSIAAEHNFRFGSSGIRFSPYFSAHWSDEYFFSYNNFDEGHLHNGQLPYWSFNLSLRLIDDVRNWRFEIYGYNLTDERIRVWQDGGPGYVRSNFAKPRNFGFKIAAGF